MSYVPDMFRAAELFNGGIGHTPGDISRMGDKEQDGQGEQGCIGCRAGIQRKSGYRRGRSRKGWDKDQIGSSRVRSRLRVRIAGSGSGR